RCPASPVVLSGTCSGIIPQTCRRRRRCPDCPRSGLILELIICYPRPVVTIRCVPRTENCLTNTHYGRAFFNSNSIISRHSHRQLAWAKQLSSILSNLVAYGTQQRKALPNPFNIRGEFCKRHQSLDR